MVKINLALIALVTLGPALSIAGPTGVEIRDVAQDNELVERGERNFRCDYGDRMARAKTVAACVDDIAAYGRNGRICTSGSTRELCKKFSGFKAIVVTGGETRSVAVPCIQWAQDIGALLDRCTQAQGLVRGTVWRDNYAITVTN